MESTSVTAEKKRKRKRPRDDWPRLSERDQRLIVGFLTAYSINVERARDGDKRLLDAAPDMDMFRTRYTRWVNILSGIKEAMILCTARQGWLAGATQDQIERMEF